MHVELQIKSSTLLALLRNRIEQHLPCIPQTLFIPVGSQTVGVVVDHIGIGADTTFQRKHGVSIPIYDSSLTGSLIQVKQSISVYLASLFDLAGADTEPLSASEYIRVDIALIFDIQLAHSKDGWQPTFALDKVESPVAVPDSVLQALQSAVAGLAPSTPLDIDALSALIGSAEIAQAGVGADEKLTVLAFRLEIQSGPREGFGQWQAFFDGIVDVRLPIKWTTQGPPVVQFGPDGKPIKKLTYQPPPEHHVIDGDWSMFVDAALLIPAVEAKLIDNANSSQSKFYLDGSSVDATWIAISFNANLLATFSGYVVAPISGVDIDVDVRAGVGMWIDASINSVVARLEFSYDVSLWDEVKAGLIDAIVTASGGAVLGGIAGPIGALVGAVVGFVIGFVGTFVAASVVDKSLPSTPELTKIDDTTYSYSTPLPAINEPLVGQLSATELVGLDDGALLVGGLAVGAGATPNLTSVQVQGFGWRYHDPCGSPALYADADVSLSTDGAPLTLCNLTVPAGADPLGVLYNTISVTGGSGTSGSIEIDIAIPAEALQTYLAAPYPLQILIQTNGGARLVSIPAIGQPDQEALALALVAAQIGCTKTSDGFWNGSGYNVHWSVDPGPETVQLVQAVARGLGAGDDVQLREPSGNVLARATANAAGFAVASVVATARQTSLVVVRGEHATREHGVVREGRRLSVSRTPMRLVTSIRTRRACHAVKLGSVDGVLLLLCITSHGLHEVFDLSNAARPLWRAQFSMPGLRGVLRWGGHLVLWGSAGLRVATRDLQCARLPVAVARKLPAGAVRMVTARGSKHLNVQMEDGTILALQPWGGTNGTSDGSRNAAKPDDPWFDTASRAGRLLARVGAMGTVEIWEAGTPIVAG